MEVQHKLFPRRCDTCFYYKEGCATHDDPDCIGCKRYHRIKKEVLT